MAPHFDLAIVGTGSGNTLITPEMDGWKIAVIERGVFGGTCLNRGCIPSKMLIYPADLAAQAADSGRYGIASSFDGADWPAIVARVFGRIDAIAEGGRRYRHQNAHVTVFEHEARFTGERRLAVGGEELTAERIVLAVGSRPVVPSFPGLSETGFHTSDTIMRLPALPGRLVILGGGYIAAELGHVFSALGSRVTMINRSHGLLIHEDLDVSAAYTAAVAERFDVRLGARVDRVERTADGIAVRYHTADDTGCADGDVLLVCTGRQPNGDQLDAAAGGVHVGPDGHILVDAFGRTSAAGVWALGDANGRYQLKHMANGEAKVVTHNLLHPDALRRYDSRPAPRAVFGHPQVGTVGLTEHQARAAGRHVVAVRHPYSGTAYGWALEDTSGFVKLVGDPETRTLVGAHIIGHEASMLVQLLVQGMHLGSTVEEMAGQVWIHPALTEVVEQALLALIDAFDGRPAEPTSHWPIATTTVGGGARRVSPDSHGSG